MINIILKIYFLNDIIIVWSKIEELSVYKKGSADLSDMPPLEGDEKEEVKVGKD